MDYRDFKKYRIRKSLLGLTLGLVLAIIVLNVDKKLWLPLELETINGRNVSSREVIDHPAIKENIVVILFDDKTQFLLRQNGIPIKDFEKKGRDLLREAIEKLESYKVKSIGININLNSSSGTQADEKLAKTISLFKNIIIADSLHSLPTYPPNSILQGASDIGYGDLYADYDRIVHKINLIDHTYKDIPSFSYALFKNSTLSGVDLKLKNKNEFYLKYLKNPFKKYSFIDLIDGKIKSSFLRDKIIILGIGLNSKLIRDQLLNPFEKSSYTSDSEVQATALANLFSKDCLLKFSLSHYPVLFILLSIILGLLFSSISPLRSLIAGSIVFVGILILSQINFTYNQILIELVPLLFLLLGNLIIGSLVYLHLNLQEQNIELENAFSMLNKRTKELEGSKFQVQNKNIELTSTLTELNKRVNELKEVRKQLSNRSEEERKRIARELHDDTLARITDLRRHIESMIYSPNLSIEAKKDLGVSIQTMDNVTSEIRRIINALRPSMLDNTLGLIPAIENLLDELTKRSKHKIQTQLISKLTKLELSDSVEINLYRIIQEALNNVFKHSNATKAEVIVEEQPGQILILVNDNGGGFANQDKKGFGLIDMKERAELIGINIQYLNKPKDTGTTLEITIPEEKILMQKTTRWRATAGVSSSIN